MSIPLRVRPTGLIALFLGLACLLLSLGFVLVGNARFAQSVKTGHGARSFKVGLVLPYDRNDGGWNEAGCRGLHEVSHRLGATVACVDNQNTPRQMASALENYAKAGFDVVIGHGGQFIQPAEQVASTFPETRFVIVGRYAGNNRNLTSVSFRDEESGYIAGRLAARRTKTGKVAYVAGELYPHMQAKADAFVRGALAEKADTDAQVLYLHTWTDVDHGRVVGESLLMEGVDTVAVDADVAGDGLHEAFELAQKHAIGWVRDQSLRYPRSVFANVDRKSTRLSSRT